MIGFDIAAKKRRLLKKMLKRQIGKRYDLNQGTERHNLTCIVYDIVFTCFPPSHPCFSRMWSEIEDYFQPRPNAESVFWGEDFYENEVYSVFIRPHLPMYKTRTRELIDDEIRRCQGDCSASKTIKERIKNHYYVDTLSEFEMYVFRTPEDYKSARDHFETSLRASCAAPAISPEMRKNLTVSTLSGAELKLDSTALGDEAVDVKKVAVTVFEPAPIPSPSSPTPPSSPPRGGDDDPSDPSGDDGGPLDEKKSLNKRLEGFIRTTTKSATGFSIDIKAENRPERIIRYMFIHWTWLIVFTLAAMFLYMLPWAISPYARIVVKYLDKMKMFDSYVERELLKNFWILGYVEYQVLMGCFWLNALLVSTINSLIWVTTYPVATIIYYGSAFNYEWEPYYLHSPTYLELIQWAYPEHYYYIATSFERNYDWFMTEVLDYYMYALTWAFRSLLLFIYVTGNKMIHPADISRYWHLIAKKQKPRFLRMRDLYTMSIGKIKRIKLESHEEVDLRHTATKVGDLEITALVKAIVKVRTYDPYFDPIQEGVESFIRLISTPLAALPRWLRVRSNDACSTELKFLPIIAADIADLKGLTYMNQRDYLERVRLLVSNLTTINYNKFWTLKKENLAMNTVIYVSALKRFFENERTGNFEVALWTESADPVK